MDGRRLGRRLDAREQSLVSVGACANAEAPRVVPVAGLRGRGFILTADDCETGAIFSRSPASAASKALSGSVAKKGSRLGSIRARCAADWRSDQHVSPGYMHCLRRELVHLTHTLTSAARSGVRQARTADTAMTNINLSPRRFARARTPCRPRRARPDASPPSPRRAPGLPPTRVAVSLRVRSARPRAPLGSSRFSSALGARDALARPSPIGHTTGWRMGSTAFARRPPHRTPASPTTTTTLQAARS